MQPVSYFYCILVELNLLLKSLKPAYYRADLKSRDRLRRARFCPKINRQPQVLSASKTFIDVSILYFHVLESDGQHDATHTHTHRTGVVVVIRCTFQEKTPEPLRERMGMFKQAMSHMAT